MEEFKYFIKVLLTIVEKAGPTVATIIAVYLAYRYAKKQKWFEDKTEEYKKVRRSISNLIQIWRELSYIEFYSSSEDFLAELLFKDPKLASSYFGIDVRRIKKFRALFHESKEELKSINVSLFYDLEHSFMEFNKTFSNFTSSSQFRKNEKEDLKDLINPMLKEIIRDLESIISDTAEYLPAKEKKEILEIFSRHQKDLNRTEFESEVPKFIVNWINKLVPVVEPITDEDMKVFVSDHTVKMIINKAFPMLIGFILRDNPFDTLHSAKTMITNPNQFEGILNEEDLENMVLKIEITDIENNLFKNNRAFYDLLCACYKKFSINIPFAVRRIMVQLNNGTIDVKKEIEVQKANIILKKYNGE
jgi:hypothetical protein